MKHHWGINLKNVSLLGATLVITVIWIAQSHAEHEALFPMPSGPSYVEECGSCHTAYAPGLLPARSWSKMMAELDQHFGEDSSLEAETRDTLLAELTARAADSSQASLLMRRIADSVPRNEIPQRISTGRFFKYMHDEVFESIWKRPKVGSRSNCIACHVNANKGRYPEPEVRIPK